MNEDETRRIALRYKVENLKVKLYDGEINADVIEVSLEGFSFVADKKIDYGTRRRAPMLFLDGNQPAFHPLHGYIIGEDQIEDDGIQRFRYSVKLDSTLRPERLGNFNKYAKPATNGATTRQRFELQKTLALNDLDALQRGLLSVKDCQFRLILAALPLLIGLVGSAFGYAIALAKPNNLILLLPPICAYLSGAMLAVFLQKVESVR